MKKETFTMNYTGIELCFLDQRKSALRLTARLCIPSPEKEITYYINDEKITLELGKHEQIGGTYRYIFEIFIDISRLSEQMKIDFEYDVCTGPFFPTDFRGRLHFIWRCRKNGG